MPLIREARVARRDVPLAATFATSRDTAPRTSVVVCSIIVVSDTGHCGIGEAVPVPYVTGETPQTCMQALSAIAPALVAIDLSCWHHELAALNTYRQAGPSARAAVEMALWGLYAAVSGKSLWELFGAAQPQIISDVTLPLVSDTVERAALFRQQGFHIFKVKVGRSTPREDVDVLQRVREAVPEAVFRIDANQAFDADTILQLVEMALSSGLTVELLEQPVHRHDRRGLDLVARNSPIPVLADEAVLTVEDARFLMENTAVHGVNVKLMKSGVLGALEIARVVRDAGRKLMMGCMLETSRGIGFALSLAAGTGAFDYYDLDGHMLTEAGAANPFFEQEGERLRVNPR